MSFITLATRSPRSIGGMLTLGMTLLVTMLLFALAFLATAATADEADEADAPRSELEELGMTLKAAVVSGNMTSEEARAIWAAAAESEKIQGEIDKERSRAGNDESAGSNSDDPKHWIGRQIPPDPKHPVMLLEPEFLPRDSRSLSNRLELDHQRALLVETIVRDYIEAFEAIATPLPDALERYQQADSIREMQQALNRVDSKLIQRDIDMESSIQVMKERVRGYANQSVAKEDRDQPLDEDAQAELANQRAEQWTSELAVALEAMDERMIRLRNRMQARIERVEQVGETVTARDLVRIAKALRDNRVQLRSDLIEMLELVLVVQANEDEHARLDEALGRLRIEHGLRHARMGGENIDPWAALVETYPGRDPAAEGQAVLAEQDENLATLMSLRSEAAINREIEALELLVVHDDLVAEAGSEDNVPLETWLTVLEPFARAWTDQVDSSARYRDAVLSMVEETTFSLSESDPEAGTRYRDIAMRRGFPPETRVRWCERALHAAVELEALDEDTRIVLEAIQLNTAEELRRIRDSAIRKRIKREPELARKPVLALWGLDGTGERPFAKEDWAGQEYQAHETLDEQTESTLRTMLTAEQFAALPRRPGSDGSDKKAGSGRRARGKARGGKNAKGNSRGSASGKQK